MTQANSQYTQSSQELMARLREPAALVALEVARHNKWLSVDTASLDALFAAEPNHPVRKLLADDAKTGGAFGLMQYCILMGFFGLAFMATMFHPKMPPMLFVMWGAIGVAVALMTRKYPALIFGKFPGKRACTAT